MKLFTHRAVSKASFMAILFLSWGFLSKAQIPFRVMSYNVENAFDPRPDSIKEDHEFLPDGARRWTWKRYWHKLHRLSQTIAAAGEWDTPALIGLCEVENDSVLVHLLTRTPLKRQNYRYRITHSPDRRGINVALLYQRDRFRYLGDRAVAIRFSGKRHKQTRDILHVWGEVNDGDTLDVFVCHFPSRYGGEKESEKDRFDAALTLRAVCDSLSHIRQAPRLLIMGDLNDGPTDRSLTEFLQARPYRPPLRSSAALVSPDVLTYPDVLASRPDALAAGRSSLHFPSRPTSQQIGGGNSEDLSPAFPGRPLILYNLFADSRLLSRPGTHKYQGEWTQLDHMIVNAPVLNPASSFRLIPGSMRIFDPSFLLVLDKTWLGVRPFRTYYGFKYEGGYSDHLPILADFLIDSKEAKRR